MALNLDPWQVQVLARLNEEWQARFAAQFNPQPERHTPMALSATATDELTRTDTTGSDTNQPTDAAAEATPDAPESAEAAETKAKAEAFRKRQRPMGDDARAKRLAKYPNPKTVNVAEFLTACRAESGSRSWCETAQSYVRSQITVDVNGRSVGLLADYPQWNPETGEYDRWSINPQIPAGGITEIPAADVLRCMSAVLEGGYNDSGYTVGMENILSAVRLTYVDSRPSYTVKFEYTFTPDEMRRYGSEIRSTETPNRQLTRAARLVRQWLDYNGNVGLSVSEVTPE